MAVASMMTGKIGLITHHMKTLLCFKKVLLPVTSLSIDIGIHSWLTLLYLHKSRLASSTGTHLWSPSWFITTSLMAFIFTGFIQLICHTKRLGKLTHSMMKISALIFSIPKFSIFYTGQPAPKLPDQFACSFLYLYQSLTPWISHLDSTFSRHALLISAQWWIARNPLTRRRITNYQSDPVSPETHQFHPLAKQPLWYTVATKILNKFYFSCVHIHSTY